MGVALVVGGPTAGCALPPFVPGGLYSVAFDEHGYRVAKVLVVDEHAVHVRIYKEPFATRPAQVDPAALTLGRIDDPNGFGMGHLPLAEREFRSWNPHLIRMDKVTEDELEGYRYWQESNGGVWDPKCRHCPTTRCSGRTGVSRRLLGRRKRRATRRAAERER